MNTNEKPLPNVKRARQVLLSRIRDDWTFAIPLTSVSTRPESSQNGGDGELLKSMDGLGERRISTTQEGIGQFDPAAVTEWRERTYASSDPSSDELEEEDETESSRAFKSVAHSLTPMHSVSAWNNGSATVQDETMAQDHEDNDMDGMFPRKFLGPTGQEGARPRKRVNDGLNEEQEKERRQARKRRRGRRLDREMEWNVGLRAWEAQRDAWCCARRVDRDALAAVIADDLSHTMEEGATDRDTQHNTTTNNHLSLRQVAPPSNMATTTTLIPLAPPLLPPTDPTRRSLNPSLYPFIYQKVVTQSLTPSIPINLSHLIPAIVQGWKDAGEWPPKATNPGTLTNGNGEGNGNGNNERSSRVSQGMGKAQRIIGLGNYSGSGLSAAGRRLMRRHRRGGGSENSRDGDVLMGLDGTTSQEGEGGEKSSSFGAGAGAGAGAVLKGMHAKVGKRFKFSLSGVSDEKG